MDSKFHDGLIGLVVGAAITSIAMQVHYKKELTKLRTEAIEHKCAAYNAITGNWEWSSALMSKERP